MLVVHGGEARNLRTGGGPYLRDVGTVVGFKSRNASAGSAPACLDGGDVAPVEGSVEGGASDRRPVDMGDQTSQSRYSWSDRSASPEMRDKMAGPKKVASFSAGIYLRIASPLRERK
jgi:hypothetical protein